MNVHHAGTLDEVYVGEEVGVFGRIFRTWRSERENDEDHVRAAILTLIGLSPEDVARVEETPVVVA